MWIQLTLLMCLCRISIAKVYSLEALKHVFDDPDPLDKSISFIDVYNDMDNVTVNTSKVVFYFDKDASLNFENIQHYQEVQEVWFRFSEHSKVYSIFNWRKINIQFASQDLRIEKMHFNALFDIASCISFLSKAKNLQVVDLGHSNSISDQDTLKQIIITLGCKKNLKAISLNSIVSKEAVLNLNFSHFNLTEIFSPIRSIGVEYLDLSHNEILTISGCLNEILPKLRILDLTGNKIIFFSSTNINDPQSVLCILFHQNVEVFNIEFYDDLGFVLNHPYPHVPLYGKQHFESFKNRIRSCLTELDTTINIVLQNKTEFCLFLSCLFEEKLNIGRNRLYNIFKQYFEYIPNVYDNIDITCNGFIKYPLPPKLKEIFLRHRVQTFHNISPKRICFMKNVVKEISYIEAEIYSDINTIKGLDMLMKLRLVNIANKQMQFHFNDSSYPKHVKKLEQLTIEGNHISLGDNFTFSKISTKLTAIDLLNNNMKKIPKNVFQMLKSLRTINISSNVLQSLNLNFSNLVTLESLDVSNNPIKYLETDTISSLMSVERNSTLKLYIHNSELLCTCQSESLQTMEFLKNANKYGIDVDNLEDLSCIYNSLRQPLLTVDVNHLKKECFPSHLNIILGSTLSNLICIIVGVLIFTAYKYRYRLYITFLRLKWKQKLWNTLERRRYSYDAFLSYCALDRFWVHNVLVKELEEKYGFKLCIHYRDFGFGDIADVIVQNITDSRYTIIILSEQSLDSPWCQFELKVAHGNSVRIGNELILIKLGEINRSDVNVPLVKELLDSRVYLQWPESAAISDDSKDVRYQEICALFWVRISNILYAKPMNHSCCCGKYFGYESLVHITYDEEEANDDNHKEDPDECRVLV